ncbi:catalytic protein [Salix suchowensis]|nr:catalytic protein [Salix suchowensis]
MASSSTLIYLGLPPDYRPSPQDEPLEFLTKHLLLQCTTPKQRTTIPLIRNRRLKYIESSPGEFKFESARNTWAALWEGQDHRVLFKQSGEEERAWAKREFMSGSTQHVGKLGDLLAGYEEERQAEHMRDIRRATQREDYFIPEEDDDDSEDDLPPDVETPAQAQSSFLRLLKERFIYGLLEGANYDAADWNETWDVDEDRDAEEKWFDDEEDEDEMHRRCRDNLLTESISFKGNDDTFAKFPERLQHTLSQSTPSSKVECIVFPAYENEAVIRLADWLTTITVNREVASGGGAGKVRIVLCGHRYGSLPLLSLNKVGVVGLITGCSMGGLLAADSLLEFLKTRPDQEAPLWPNIVACIAFDTPVSTTILSSTADSLDETPVVPGAPPVCFQEQRRSSCQYATTAHTAVTGLLTAFGGWKAASTTTNQAQRRPVAAITAPLQPSMLPQHGVGGRLQPLRGQRSCGRRCSRGSLLPARYPWRRLQMVRGPYEVRWDLVE